MTEPKCKTLTQLAAEIHAHLRRIEADPKINRMDKRTRTHHYYFANAYQGGRYVRVTYVNYQGASSLTRDEAERYLAWLDAGNVGTHWEALR